MTHTGNRHDEDEPLERIHVRLFASDVEEIRMLFAKNLGINKAVRLMIRQHLRYLREKSREATTAVQGIEI